MDKYQEQIPDVDKVIIIDEKISIEFKYPLSVKVKFGFKKKGGFSKKDLFHCIYEGYKKIYDEEMAEVGDPGTYDNLFNRKKSDGKYGIWGHSFGELFIEKILYNPKKKLITMIVN